MFIAKKLGAKWGVYDTVLGSYPYQRVETGPIKQETTEEEAAKEAARLNDLPGGT
jgi:hypothetical protein